jgi:hypothetical protein
MGAWLINGWRAVLVLVDNLHRHEAIARIGQSYRHGSGVEVENSRRIERVAVLPDNVLMVDRWNLALMSSSLRATAEKYLSDSARMKLSTVTGTVPTLDCDWVFDGRLDVAEASAAAINASVEFLMTGSHCFCELRGRRR